MKPAKPDKSVSNMDVLKDIRGLLSATSEREKPAGARIKDGGLKAKAAQLEEQLARYKEQIQKQQDELHALQTEKKELVSQLNTLSRIPDRPAPPVAGASSLEIDQLEAKKAELSSAVSQVDSLLQLKARDLLRRIARVFEEAGQGDIAIDLRRTGNTLEDAENFGNFVRALLGE
jgi:SMC interacting uncharacterized protein involved in chromosome segregation